MSSDNNTFRTISMSLSEASVDYATRLEWCNNLMDKEEVRNPIDSFQLSYTNERETGNPISKVADSSALKKQCVSNKDLVLNRATISSEHVYNIQIPYDVNQALDPKS